MSRRLFWRLCLFFAAGIVALFYVINLLAIQAEQDMSLLAEEDRQQLKTWGLEAEQLYLSGDYEKLKQWLLKLEQQEQSQAAVLEHNIKLVAGDKLNRDRYTAYNFGRSVDWKIHLHFKDSPVMEVPFSQGQSSFLIQLPERMHPGTYWQTTRWLLHIVLPMALLALLAIRLYAYIMQPLSHLQKATKEFARGNYDVRASQSMLRPHDELSELAQTFDQMAAHIGKQLVNQRQLIADLSHELRTPLTRLDIALDAAQKKQNSKVNLNRVERESKI